MAGVLFVYEGAVARRCRRRLTRPCVFVCCVFYCLLLLLLLLLFVHAGVCCVASVDV